MSAYAERSRPAVKQDVPVVARPAQPVPKERSARAGASVPRRQTNTAHSFEPLTIRAEDAYAGSLTDQFEAAAEAGESAARAEVAARPTLTLTISNEEDLATANALIEQLESYEPQLEKGFADGNISPQVFAANEHAKNLLGNFLVSGGSQGQVLSEFQHQYKICKGDAGRFLGQLNYFMAQNPAAAPTGGGALVEKVTARSSKDTLHDVRDFAANSAVFAGQWGALNRSHISLQNTADAVGQAQQRQLSATHNVMARLSALEAGVVSRLAASPQSRGTLAKVTAETAAIKALLGKGVGLITLNLPGGAAVSAIANEVIGGIVDQVFAKNLTKLHGAIQKAEVSQEDFANAEVENRLRAAISSWVGGCLEYQACARALTREKQGMRANAAMLATTAEADTAGEGGEIAILAQMFGEADALSAQCRATLDLGRAEQNAAGYANADLVSIRGDEQAKWANGVVYYRPVPAYRNRMRTIYDPRSIGMTYEALENHVGFNIVSSSGRTGHTEGRLAGVNPIMAMSLADLEETLETVNSVRNQLGKALAMGDLDDGRVELSPIPSHRSALKENPQ